jgi:acetoin utilization deacetylase AcuC-like enzyme
MNVARGFHHAVYERGSGYCAINGLAIVPHCMPGLRVFVIDCDEHGGNGTEEFAARLPNLYCASIFGTRFGCYGGVRSWAFKVEAAPEGFQRYLSALGEVRCLLQTVRPDLVIYQAGVDCHQDDPKSRSGLTTSNLFDRDVTVFNMVRGLNLPILFVVAGGYQQAEKVARLNCNTVRAARYVYRSLFR